MLRQDQVLVLQKDFIPRTLCDLQDLRHATLGVAGELLASQGLGAAQLEDLRDGLPHLVQGRLAVQEDLVTLASLVVREVAGAGGELADAGATPVLGGAAASAGAVVAAVARAAAAGFV